jgi:hypothetical protein
MGPAAGGRIACRDGRLAAPPLVWRAASDPSGIATYAVEWRPLAARGGTLPTRRSTTRDTTMAIGAACAGAGYEWRVAATDRAGNEGTWSPWRGLAVRAGAARLIDAPRWPSPGSRDSLAPSGIEPCRLTIAWGAAPASGARYEVQLERRDRGARGAWSAVPLAAAGVTDGTRLDIGGALRPSTDYRWRVLAFTDGGAMSLPMPWLYFSCLEN